MAHGSQHVVGTCEDSLIRGNKYPFRLSTVDS